MKITIVGKHQQLRDSVKELVESKLMKMDKFFESDVTAKATIGHIKDLQTAEITIFLKEGAILRAEETADEIETAVDRVMDKLVRQLRKHKTNIEKRFRKNTSIRYENLQTPEVSASNVVEESEPKIVRTKAFSVKPMSPEEAVLQMEMLQHNFYVYKNDKTEALNVVYKRRQGDYGLIEAQI